MPAKTIGVIGLGYVGQPVAAAMANVGYQVVGMDVDEQKVVQLAATHEPTIYEPGLAETLARCRDRLRFTTSYDDVVGRSDVLCITVGTPVDERGRPNTSNIDDVASELGARVRPGQVIILRSTVVPGTTVAIAERLGRLSQLKPGRDFFVSFCPERTIEGVALYELYNLPTIVGGINAESTARTVDVMQRLGTRIITVSSPTVAELCKLADNIYRALNVAFANEFGSVCERAGVDAYEVVQAVNSAYHRTNIFRPGLGADGPCLSKDPWILRHFADSMAVATPVIDAANHTNRMATLRVAREVRAFIERYRMTRPRVAFLGLSFKGMPETDDLRGSAAQTLFDDLTSGQGSRLDPDAFTFFDPLVRDFNGYKVTRLEHCLAGAHVVLFLSDHPSLRNTPVDQILATTARPLLVVDAWHNVTDLDRATLPADVTYIRIGDGR